MSIFIKKQSKFKASATEFVNDQNTLTLNDLLLLCNVIIHKKAAESEYVQIVQAIEVHILNCAEKYNFGSRPSV